MIIMKHGYFPMLKRWRINGNKSYLIAPLARQ